MKIKLNKRKNINIIYDDNINEITYRFMIYCEDIHIVYMTKIRDVNTYSFRSFIHTKRFLGKSVNVNPKWNQYSISYNYFGLTIIGLKYY